MSDFYLPLGHPPAHLTGLDLETYLQTLAANLKWDEAKFAADQVRATYTLEGDLADSRKIYALWPGDYYLTTVDDYKMVTTVLRISIPVDLRRIFGEDISVPYWAEYGPLPLDTQQPGPLDTERSYRLNGGEEIGELLGDSFQFTLQDQNGMYLNPLEYFWRFDTKKLWHIPLPDTDPWSPLTPGEFQLDPTVFEIGNDIVELEIDEGVPHLIISNHLKTVHNPSESLPPHHFSFISTDEIRLKVGNLPEGATVAMAVEDQSAMYRTTSQNPASFTVNLDDHQAWPLKFQEIIPGSEILKPNHKAYKAGTKCKKPGNGKCSPGKPLTYAILVQIKHSPAAGSQVTYDKRIIVSQDEKDIIRQEYVFHNLTPPERSHFHRRTEAMKKKEQGGWTYKDWLVNPYDVNEIEQVIAFMTRRFSERAFDLRQDEPDLFKKITLSSLFELKVTSSWRNPERNEAVGGQQTSNHQYGQALDLTPPHAHKIKLKRSVFDAGLDFLRELISLNGADKCTEVEIFLEGNKDILWKYYVDNGQVKQKPKGQAAFDVPNPLASPRNAAQEAAFNEQAKKADHIHIAWPPNESGTPLVLPSPTPEQFIPPDIPLKNIILIAAEDDSVPGNEQIPLNHIAQTIKAFLEEHDPDIPTEIINKAGNPIDYIQAMVGETEGVWHQWEDYWDEVDEFLYPDHRIRYFFSLSRARPAALVLTHYDDAIPYGPLDDETKPQIHDREVHDSLRGFHYEHTDFYWDEEYDDWEPDEDDIPFIGDLDDLNFKTHEIRVSNLTRLMEIDEKQIRYAFKDTQGVFIIGFRANDDTPVTENGFSQELANLIRKRVYGGILDPRRFFVIDRDETVWTETGIDELNRKTAPPQNKMILPMRLQRGEGLALVPLIDPKEKLLDYYKKLLLIPYDSEEG